MTSSTITVKPQSYAVLSHFGTWTGIGTRTARVDAEHTKFVKLMYGDTEIDASNYTITKGSTVITLNESHLKNYAKGTHWFVAEFTDGSSEPIRLDVASDSKTSSENLPKTNQTQTKAYENKKTLPNTGDTNKPSSLIISFSGILLISVFFYILKQRKNNEVN